MQPITLFLAVCLAASVTAESTGSLTTDQKCAQLEKAITIYLSNRMVPDMLYSIMRQYLLVDRNFLDRLVTSSKLDFVQSRSARHQLACKLAAAKSRQDVATIMGVPKWHIDNWYAKLQSPMLEVGSIKNLDDVAKVATLLLIWAENSHYPVMPYRINDQKTLKTFGAIKKAMMSKHIHDSLIDAPFPLKVSPSRALQKLKSARSYNELERGVFMEPGSLEDFVRVVEAHPGYLREGKASIMGTMQLLKALDATGILNFPK